MYKQIFLFFLFLQCILLQACVPVIIAGATASGMILNERREMSTILNDKQMQQQILFRLTSNALLSRKTHITVSVFNGTVLICGEAPSQALRNQVVNIVKLVRHRRAYNQIQISSPTSIQSRTEDTIITAKVKAAMLTHRRLKSMQIKIVTENKIVYLLGIVSPQQGHLAAQTARKIMGVEKVIKLFEYTQDT